MRWPRTGGSPTASANPLDIRLNIKSTRKDAGAWFDHLTSDKCRVLGNWTRRGEDPKGEGRRHPQVSLPGPRLLCWVPDFTLMKNLLLIPDHNVYRPDSIDVNSFLSYNFCCLTEMSCRQVRPGSVREHVPRRQDVRPHQAVEALAQEGWGRPEKVNS